MKNLPLNLLEDVSDKILLTISEELNQSNLPENAYIRRYMPADRIGAFSIIELNVIVRLELAKRFSNLLIDLELRY